MYKRQVQDYNLCQYNLLVVVDQPEAITNISTYNQPLCNGDQNGSITITSNGGTLPYTYSIDNGLNYQTSATFNNLTAGTYNIIVQDYNGCTDSVSVQVTEPDSVTNLSSITIPSCNGYQDGSITITSNGGTLPYTYSIDNGLNYQTCLLYTSDAADE